VTAAYESGVTLALYGLCFAQLSLPFHGSITPGAESMLVGGERIGERVGAGPNAAALAGRGIPLERFAQRHGTVEIGLKGGTRLIVQRKLSGCVTGRNVARSASSPQRFELSGELLVAALLLAPLHLVQDVAEDTFKYLASILSADNRRGQAAETNGDDGQNAPHCASP
jgi:hypothetical protein